MPAELLPLDDPRIQWKDATSRNGTSYKIGLIPPAEGVEAAKEISAKGKGGEGETEGIVRAKADFGVNVNWPVDDTVHNTTSDFKDKTGISNYLVGKNTEWGHVYDYYIVFNTDETYDYYFEDETGNRPAIINVTGS
ncbi:hypothetical protein EKO27_g11897 [Xylaria grammica]|uniref:Uncharacterized protein n=1 Tax=Xylaria grammica TaxID=363999 RepID=A0A439CMA5_9PEZI|nr:hypothetical protein EKO27_g11897 [Xylaria grammica]